MQQHLNPPFVIGTFENDRGRFPGVVADGKVRDLRAILPQIAATGELFQSWDANLDAIERVMSNPNTLAELDSWRSNNCGCSLLFSRSVRSWPLGPTTENTSCR